MQTAAIVAKATMATTKPLPRRSAEMDDDDVDDDDCSVVRGVFSEFWVLPAMVFVLYVIASVSRALKFQGCREQRQVSRFERDRSLSLTDDDAYAVPSE